MLSFHRFDPTPCNFPAPRVPVLPRLGARSLNVRSASLRSGLYWFRRGRYALAEACRQAGLSEGGLLLVPSYHCRSMVDPAIAVRSEVRLYPVHADLKPNLAVVRTMLQSPRPAATGLLLPHYFGFRQELDELVELCRQYDVRLIEDCSHVLFGTEAAQDATAGLGATGDYIVASPYKFFPAQDGGLLWSRDLLPREAMTLRPGIGPEVKAVVRVTRHLLSGSRLRASQAAVPAFGGDPAEWIEATGAPSRLYDAAEQRLSAFASSSWIVRHTDLARVVERRRLHYSQWLASVERFAGCRALFSTLPDDCIPYMFPMLLDRPRSDFLALKRAGVPVWRWDELAVSPCAVAADYRLRLLHLPCHQELRQEDMAWMIDAVAAVCRDGSSRGSRP